MNLKEVYPCGLKAKEHMKLWVYPFFYLFLPVDCFFYHLYELQ